jgi:hypothetical protein
MIKIAPSPSLLFGDVPQRSLEQLESSGNRGKSLIKACQDGDKNEVNALLSQLSLEEINYQNKDGNTALATLARLKIVQVVSSAEQDRIVVQVISAKHHRIEGSCLRDLDHPCFVVKRFPQMVVQR